MTARFHRLCYRFFGCGCFIGSALLKCALVGGGLVFPPHFAGACWRVVAGAGAALLTGCFVGLCVLLARATSRGRAPSFRRSTFSCAPAFPPALGRRVGAAFWGLRRMHQPSCAPVGRIGFCALARGGAIIVFSLSAAIMTIIVGRVVCAGSRRFCCAWCRVFMGAGLAPPPSPLPVVFMVGGLFPPLFAAAFSLGVSGLRPAAPLDGGCAPSPG